MFYTNNKESGFTLVETFVAITVLMIAVLGPMSLLSKALKDSIYIKDTITATFLAQEGVEIMIDKRNNGKQMDGVNCMLKFDTNMGYNCDNGLDTKFTREITVDSVPGGGHQFKIISTVSGSKLPGGEIISSSYIFKQ